VDFAAPPDETGQVKTTASFRLIGSSGLTAKAVTEGLSLAPSRSYEAGDAVTPGSSEVRKSSIWVLKSSERIEDGVELATQLERLLTLLEPRAARIQNLVNDGYRANWLCYVESHPVEHSVELNRDLLARLTALPGDLWLDVGGTELRTEGVPED
jgi:hypothetical protein